MRSFIVVLMAGGLVAGAADSRAGDGRAELTPRQILDKVDDQYRGESAKGKMTMKVVTEHWTREMEMEFYSKGKDKSLARILAPKKEEGTATLRNGDNIWNYLPKVKRVIKVPSSMMGGSWMGSHFTNDDIVKESRMVDDYDFEISFQGERKGVEVIEIKCTPKPNAAVVWGQITVVVRREGYQPIEMVYYDEDLEKARTMIFSDIEDMDGRRIPTTMKVVPADKPDEYTLVRYEKMHFGVNLPDSFFSIRNLQR